MKAITMITLTAMLMASVMAEDETEMNDFVGGVYDRGGISATAGNVAVGTQGAIIKAGDTYFTPNGVYVKAGDSYVSANRTVVRAGDSFVGYNTSQVKADNVFVGRSVAIVSGAIIFKQSWASR
jgi:hypothetical protein